MEVWYTKGMTKYCPRCEQTLPTTDFNKNKARKDGLASTCRACNSAYKKEHYANNSAKVYARVKDRRQEIRDQMWEYKASRACADCGLVDPIVMEFDHLRDKERNVSEMIARGMGWESILLEIEKCELVCANCHRRRTHTRANALLV